MGSKAPDRFLTKPEVRATLRITPRKLDELIRSRDLEAVRLGARTIRIRESALRELVERCAR
jgi:excisionase family DNA binding protein